MLYSEEQVLKSAKVAYQASMSGSNADYVASKAAALVSRCHKYDRNEPGDDISQEAVKEIAFAALDTYCTMQLYASLDSSLRE